MIKNKAILPNDFQSSFLSVEKDLELILKKLFIDSKPYSADLTDLLTVEEDSKKTLDDLINEGYVRYEPKIYLNEHDDVKAFIIISFDNFVPTDNPQYRDCLVVFDILCAGDCWSMGNYQMRPIKIAGYIDGILNNAKLTGIGTFQFVGCTETLLNEDFKGYSLTYLATHGSDDKIDPYAE